MSTVSHNLWPVMKVSFGVIALTVADFWLWPHIHSEATLHAVQVPPDNRTLWVPYSHSQQWQRVNDNWINFWKYFKVDRCFSAGGCPWVDMGMLFASFAFLNLAACAYMSGINRCSMAYTPVLSVSSNMVHQYISRGRFRDPDSNMIWSVNLGSFFGVLVWGCLNFTCEDETSRVPALMVPQVANQP